MATYPIDKIITEYGNERMTVEMTTGHILQHLKLLHETIATSNNRRQKLRDRLTTLEKAVEALRDLFHSWRKKHEPTEVGTTNDVDTTNLLTALSLTVHQLRDEVDSLKSRLEPADSAKS